MRSISFAARERSGAARKSSSWGVTSSRGMTTWSGWLSNVTADEPDAALECEAEGVGADGRGPAPGTSEAIAAPACHRPHISRQSIEKMSGRERLRCMFQADCSQVGRVSGLIIAETSRFRQNNFFFFYNAVQRALVQRRTCHSWCCFSFSRRASSSG